MLGAAPGNGCDAPTFFVETVEGQIGRLLDGFAAPAARGRLLTAWRRSPSRYVGANVERFRLRKRLGCLSEVYVAARSSVRPMTRSATP
jgi:hypothetical protein